MPISATLKTLAARALLLTVGTAGAGAQGKTPKPPSSAGGAVTSATAPETLPVTLNDVKAYVASLTTDAQRRDLGGAKMARRPASLPNRVVDALKTPHSELFSVPLRPGTPVWGVKDPFSEASSAADDRQMTLYATDRGEPIATVELPLHGALEVHAPVGDEDSFQSATRPSGQLSPQDATIYLRKHWTARGHGGTFIADPAKVPVPVAQAVAKAHGGHGRPVDQYNAFQIQTAEKGDFYVLVDKDEKAPPRLFVFDAQGRPLLSSTVNELLFQ